MKRYMRSLVLLAVAIVLLVMTGASAVQLVLGPADLTTLSERELEGKYVKAEVHAVLWEFAYSSLSTYEQASIIYYVIPMADREDYVPFTGERFIGLAVRGGSIDTAEQIWDETYAYLMGEAGAPATTFTVRGTVSALSGELLDYYLEDFENTELEGYALPYVIEPNRIGGRAVWEVIVITGLGVICLFLAALLWLRGISAARRAEAESIGLDTDQTRGGQADAKPGVDPWEIDRK